MSPIPHDKNLDSSMAMLADGYLFISKRCAQLQSDIFETRIMLQKAYCMMGEEAASIFYNPQRFTRKGAMPLNTLKLLQDRGSVQLMDGDEHDHRKLLFLSIVAPDRVAQLVNIMEDHWYQQLDKWESQTEVKLLDELQLIFTHAVCEWAGIPLTDEEAPQRAHEFGAMIVGAGSFGPKTLWAMLLRSRTESWAKNLIAMTRSEKIRALAGSPLSVIASHADLDGKPLDLEVAAVELINILRPTVAVALYVVFTAMALHQYPDCRLKLATGQGYLENFVQEVRRYYPFFPFVGGRVLQEFDWRGHHFTKGTWVLMDLYGTNHDPRIWGDPDVFRPERFQQWNGSAFNFIPQGGGDVLHNHRCPGEDITIALMKKSIEILTTGIQYEVPAQDLTIDLSKMPAIPESRFLIRNVQRMAEAAIPRKEGRRS